jgi:hypothetical protein
LALLIKLENLIANSGNLGWAKRACGRVLRRPFYTKALIHDVSTGHVILHRSTDAYGNFPSHR